jgi:putative phosphoesterase
MAMKVTRVYQTIQLPANLGVLADTHLSGGQPLPDRISEVFQQHQVRCIIHLGDIQTPSVIAQLSRLAPVIAVRGNRDLQQIHRLPEAVLIQDGNLTIGATHGHGPFFHYLWDKAQYYAQGFEFGRYRALLDSLFPTAGILLFGHTHVAYNKIHQGKLYFNPGAACAPSKHDPHPSCGILHLESVDRFWAEIITI